MDYGKKALDDDIVRLCQQFFYYNDSTSGMSAWGKGRNDGQINKNDSKNTKQIDLTERIRLLDKNTERRKNNECEKSWSRQKGKVPANIAGKQTPQSAVTVLWER